MSAHRKGSLWLVPVLLCAASAACVGNYDPQPIVQATADSIAKEARYGIRQALVRDGTNRPVPGLFYYLNSPLGSTSTVFDAAGAAVTRIGYFPDGAVDPAATSGDYIATHTFGQKEYDRDLALYYNAFRYYDAETARFTTPDAVKDSSDFLVHNVYAYTRNNPVNYVDPTGFWAMKADGQKGYKPVKAPPRRVAPRGSMQIDGPRGPRAAPRARSTPRAPAPARQRTDRFNNGADGADRQMPRYVPPSFTPQPRGHLAPDGLRGNNACACGMDPIVFEYLMGLQPSWSDEWTRQNDGVVWEILPNGRSRAVPLSAVGTGDAIYVNGLVTSLTDAVAEALEVRANSRDRVFLVYNATAGFTRDSLEWASGRMGDARAASGDTALELLRQTRGELDIYAYSQGSVITRNVLEAYLQGGGKYTGTWVTYGNAMGPGRLPPVNQLHIVNPDDPISSLVGQRPGAVQTGINPGSYAGTGERRVHGYDLGSRYGR